MTYDLDIERRIHGSGETAPVALHHRYRGTVMRILLLATASFALLATTPAAFAQEAKSPAIEAVEEGLRDWVDKPEYRAFFAFYGSRDFAPFWFADGAPTPAHHQMLDLLADANLDGLDPADYGLDELRELSRQAAAGDADALGRVDVKLTEAFLSYVRDMRRPSPDMHYADQRLTRAPGGEDMLREAAMAGSFENYLAAMGWMSPYYVELREALQLIEQRASGTGTAAVPEGPTLRPGDSGERVELLRLRLGLEPGEEYDNEVADAVRLFQSSSGLSDDGLVGPRTLAALNGPDAQHAPLLRLNMERARVLPGPWTRHIVVNIAEARLSYFGQGIEQGDMKVVVGTAETPTPIMAGMLEYATLNPYWNVPVDLARRNIAPAVLGGTSLKAMQYEALSDWTHDAVVLDPDSVDWRDIVNGDEQVRLRKLPGSNNAMGDVKFMFPNELGIYLHDTPTRHLFNERARQFSNGCVRLEDADRLGRWLFRGTLPAASSDEPEQHVVVPEPVPVYLTYLTAVAEGGTIAFAPDVYGMDTDRGSEGLLASR